MLDQPEVDALAEPALDCDDEELAFVRKLAHGIARLLPPGICFDDMVSDGRLGMLQAKKRWNPAQGASLTTFAYLRIRGAIFDGLSKQTGIPRSAWKLIEAQRAIDDYSESEMGEIGSTSDLERIAARLSEGVRHVALIHLMSQAPLGLCENDRDGSSGLDPACERDPAEEAANAELRSRLYAALATLDGEEARLIHLLFVEGLSVTECAERFKKNKSSISRWRDRILDQLRGAFFARKETRQAALREEA